MRDKSWLTQLDTSHTYFRGLSRVCSVRLYMNVRCQIGLDITKQVQVEHFFKFYDVDILNCQNLSIDSNTPTGASTNPKIFDLNKNLDMNLI